MNNKTLQFNELLLNKYEQQLIRSGKDGQAVLTPCADVPKLVVPDGPFHSDECLAVALIHLFWVRPTCHPEVVRNRDLRGLEGCLRIDVGEGIRDHYGCKSEAACSRVWQLICQTPGLVKPHKKTALDPIVQTVAAWATGYCAGPNPLGYVDDFSLAAQILGGSDQAFADCWWRVLLHIDAIVTAADAKAKAKLAAKYVIKEAVKTGARTATFTEETRWVDVRRVLWESKGSRVMFYVYSEGPENWYVLCAAHPQTEKYSPLDLWELIPEKFRGLCGDDLSNATGIPGGISCQLSGCAAKFKTREAAEAFAHLCVQLS